MKLRLYHHVDGARVAYREAGTGPALCLLHSSLLNHREWEPAVEHLTHRFRVVLPDLPLHGDSEDRPRHPYTRAWFAEVMAAFCHDACGPRPFVGGRGLGAEVLLRACAGGDLRPARLVLMPTLLHRAAKTHRTRRRLARVAARTGALPGLDRAITHAARARFRPDHGLSLSAVRNPAARDLVRHAFADIGGNANLGRSWARFAAGWPEHAERDLLDVYPRLTMPVLLLWAGQDLQHPIETAREALDLLPDGHLRVLDAAGPLLAYDDPVGLARELIAFCR